tara:strand:+ start:2339 stop:2593 length:255 start_codon:yes stop_codon:yes gene_type:complete
MTSFEVAFISIYITSAVFGLAFVAFVLKTSVRDRPHDPEAVDRLIAIVQRKKNLEEALSGVQKYRGQLPADDQLSRDQANSRRP